MSETSDKLTDVIIQNCCKPGIDREALRKTLAEMVDHAKLEASAAIAKALQGAGHNEACDLVLSFTWNGIDELGAAIAKAQEGNR